jgi:hypothetical protein
MTEPWHGTQDGYTNHDCRCDRCRAANTRAMRKYRAKIRALPTPKHVHGTDNGYNNYGCRCGRCVRAHAEAKKLQRGVAIR